jgi:hypothetical protein
MLKVFHQWRKSVDTMIFVQKLLFYTTDLSGTFPQTILEQNDTLIDFGDIIPSRF